MTDVDQFESAFKSAAKAVYQYQHLKITHVLVICDLEPGAAGLFTEQIKSFLSVPDDQTTWTVLSGEQFNTVGQLLDQINQHKPDLICSYRHLHSEAWRWPYGLGTYTDVISQQASCPLLLVPRPDSADEAKDAIPSDTMDVMAVTDHLTGDDALVNFAVRFTDSKGKLLLAHVEDQGIFDRYIEAVSRIPQINTDVAREYLLKQLLKEPRDYIQSCSKVLAENASTVQVEPIVVTGHHVSQYQHLIKEHRIDLLVMHARDSDQVAMHGVAYPLAVELRNTPLLLI